MSILRRITIIFSAIMIFLLAMILLMDKKNFFDKRDLVTYNDMLHRVEEGISEGIAISSLEKSFDCTIILSTAIEDPDLSEAYRNSAFVLDLHDEKGNYIGKVAWTDELNRYNDTKDSFFALSLIIWMIVTFIGYMIILYFHVQFIKPVKELQHFSEEIAKGNLEEPLPIHKNNVFGNFVEAFDLMREQLIEARNREIASQKAKKELITELSHDIKTPVAVIKAICEVLEAQAAKDGTSESQDKISVISKKADTISELVSNMMHANLEDLERLEVHPTEENSNIIVTYLESIKQYGNIILDNEMPGCLVYLDRIRMEQTIDNVVSNSYKYAHTDIHVFFDTYSVEMPREEDGKLEKANFLRIRIKDEGPGVPDDELPLICEKYYRGSNASEAPGSGLGFYLVKYYMGKQGGGLEYYNDNGFVVELLLRKV